MTGQPPRDKPRNRGAWDEADARAASQGGGHDPTDRTVSPGTEVFHSAAGVFVLDSDPDLRVELAKLVRAASAATTWARDQVASIDPDLPVAELDEAQLRGVVGVELLRLRRVAAAAQAEVDRAARDVEASNFRHGELVAERAALRRELEAARATNQLLTYGGRDEEGAPATLTGRLFYAARRMSEAADRQDPPAAWTEEEARAVALHIEARDLLREAAACIQQAAKASGAATSSFTTRTPAEPGSARSPTRST